jgi:ABC-type branched-subunit amino acid transport system substrate-binding protein
MKGPIKLLCATALTSLAVMFGGHVALAQSAIKIGISAAATGPASPNYAPNIEAFRMYIRGLNDRGGVNGSKVDLIVLDDKATPSEAASNAKQLMDDEQVLAVGLMSLSSTYAPVFQAATRTKTPVLLLGMGVCPANANTPEMNPYVFCGGSTSDPNTAAAWQVPLLKALGEENKDKVKLALVAMDIPISRQGVDTMEKIAGNIGVEVVDKQAIPPGAADVSGAAARIISKDANYATSYAPVSTTVQMLGALRRQGWNGWYIHNHSSDAEDILRQLRDPKLVMSPEYAFTVEKLPVFDEIGAAAKKYDVNLPVDKLSLGWASGMVLEAALKKCGAGCTKEKLLDSLIGLNVQTGGIFPDPINWTKQDHRRPASFIAYAWDEKSQSVKRISEWARVTGAEPVVAKVTK